MKKIIVLYILATTVFTSVAYAQEAYGTETLIGIGATLEKQADGTILVDALISNAPAEHAGLAIGDIIEEVKSLPNGAFVSIHNLPLDSIVALIRGPLGVPVEILFTRGNSEPIDLSIVREKFDVNDGK
jgi:C-terminal processing protease CtpA/Prc